MSAQYRHRAVFAFPIVSLVWDRRHEATSDKAAQVEIRIAYRSRQKYMVTGVKLLPGEWKNGLVVNCPDALVMNNFLEQRLHEVKAVIGKMIAEDDIDIYAVPERLERLHKKEQKVNMFDYFEKRLEVRLYKKSTRTRQHHQLLLNFLSDWRGIRDFSEITEENIVKMDKFLQKCGLQENSRWCNYHRTLNSLIIDAVNDGHLKKNPYKWLNIGKGDDRAGIGKHLTPDEFNAIKSAVMPTESLERVRDLFVFQTCTCLSYEDLTRFKIKDISEVKGKKVYAGKRGKTGIPFTIPLLPPALEVLDKYGGKLPLISNVKYNLYIKEVAKAAGLDRIVTVVDRKTHHVTEKSLHQAVTTHWGRHTGATLLLNNGVPMQIVSKICGHSSIRMTERIYAALLDETVVEAVKTLN